MIMHHVAVTRSAGYVVEVCQSAPVMCVMWNGLWFGGNLIVVVVLVCVYRRCMAAMSLTTSVTCVFRRRSVSSFCPAAISLSVSLASQR